ncbi:hypothetical protein EDB98_107175 [Pseudomonas fluorescens]|jgi:hypothetical protein|nr:hypothetical protein EDB98_107175 [Pseudomonas fluorescens]
MFILSTKGSKVLNFIWGIGFLLLAGCTNTPANLMSDPAGYDGSIQANVTAQSAYRNIRQASRICLEHSPLGTPVTTEGEFDSELSSGRITQRMVAQGVRLSLAIITIEPAPEGIAEIKLYTLKGWSTIGVKAPTLDKLRSWIKGDQSC